MAKERWKQIDEFPNYSVSSEGRVASRARGKEKILKTSNDRYGYPKVTLSNDGVKTTKSVHQLVAKAFIPNQDEKAQVNHIKGHKMDNRVCSLEWVSNADNIRHAYKTGLNIGPKKKVRVVETGEVYPSEKECAIAVNGTRSGVNGCLKGRRYTHAGFHYEYVE